jgi:hypothetical protein
MATRRDSAAHNRFDFGERVGFGIRGVWKFRESAVRTAVPAKIRQRDEDVPRDADDIALTLPLALGGALEHDLPNDRGEKLRGKPLGGTTFEPARVYRGGDQSFRFSAGQRSLAVGSTQYAALPRRSAAGHQPS